MTIKAIVPWHNKDQIKLFCDAWGVSMDDPTPVQRMGQSRR